MSFLSTEVQNYIYLMVSDVESLIGKFVTPETMG